jgi:hypothetical protein
MDHRHGRVKMVLIKTLRARSRQSEDLIWSPLEFNAGGGSASVSLHAILTSRRLSICSFFICGYLSYSHHEQPLRSSPRIVSVAECGGRARRNTIRHDWNSTEFLRALPHCPRLGSQGVRAGNQAAGRQFDDLTRACGRRSEIAPAVRDEVRNGKIPNPRVGDFSIPRLARGLLGGAMTPAPPSFWEGTRVGDATSCGRRASILIPFRPRMRRSSLTF